MLLPLVGIVTGALIGIGPALFLANKAERRERARELQERQAKLLAATSVALSRDPP